MSPKVSDDYLEARRAQILDAARRCFVRSGYHRTTMQDVCKEAKLSPGAVYRYFEGKEAIFEGLAERRLAAHSEAMGCMEGLDNLFESTARFAKEMMSLSEKYGAPRPGVMDLELAGESMNNPRIAAVVRKMIEGVRSNLSGLVARLQGEGKLDPALDTKAVASVLMALFQGALFQSAIGLDFDHAAYLKVVCKLRLPKKGTDHGKASGEPGPGVGAHDLSAGGGAQCAATMPAGPAEPASKASTKASSNKTSPAATSAQETATIIPPPETT